MAQRLATSAIREKLSVATARKEADRKTSLSMVTPAIPGSRAVNALSMSRVIAWVSPIGNFSTTSTRPGLPSTIASPISGW